MQFSTVALLFAAVANAATITETDLESTLVTITDCDTTVTDCPASSSVVPTNSTSNVSTWEGAANRQYAAGAAALAAGALLAL